MQPKKQRKFKFSAPIGGLFILFAVIGIITIVVTSFNFTKSVMDNRRQKEIFQDLIHPVVMFDPPAFSSPSELDMQKLLLYSMWGTLADEKSLTYSRSEENQSLLVPASDLDASARKLFGDKITLQHTTFTDNETVYFYDEEIKKYEVPTYGFLYVYHPEILDVSKEKELSANSDNDFYQILVNYIPPDNAWNSVYSGGIEQFSNKYMVYILEKADDGWHLASVKYPPAEILKNIPGAILDDLYTPPELPPELPVLGESGTGDEQSK